MRAFTAQRDRMNSAELRMLAMYTKRAVTGPQLTLRELAFIQRYTNYLAQSAEKTLLTRRDITAAQLKTAREHDAGMLTRPRTRETITVEADTGTGNGNGRGR